MILEKTKPHMPYVRPHKVVHTFDINETSYSILQYNNTKTYGILITDNAIKISSLYKPFTRMETIQDVVSALRTGSMFKPAQIVEKLNR